MYDIVLPMFHHCILFAPNLIPKLAVFLWQEAGQEEVRQKRQHHPVQERWKEEISRCKRPPSCNPSLSSPFWEEGPSVDIKGYNGLYVLHVRHSVDHAFEFDFIYIYIYLNYIYKIL